MRLFIAIDLPEEIKEELYKQLDPLRKKYPDFTWVDPQNYHLTLHFIGETYKEEEIKKKIKDLLYDQFSFHLYAYDLDLFFSHKITIYLSFRREKKLEELAEKIGDNLKSFNQGNGERKDFIAHLTIARYRVPSKQQYLLIKKTVLKQEIDIEFPVDKIYLFESILTSSKPIYKKLASFPLLK